MQIDLHELRKICEFETKLSKEEDKFFNYIKLTKIMKSLNYEDAFNELKQDAENLLDIIQIAPASIFNNTECDNILLNMNYKIFFDYEYTGYDKYGLYPYLVPVYSNLDEDFNIDYEKEIYNEILLTDSVNDLLFNVILLENFDKDKAIKIIDKICNVNNIDEDTKINKLIINISDYDDEDYFYSYEDFKDPNKKISFIPHSYC